MKINTLLLAATFVSALAAGSLQAGDKDGFGYGKNLPSESIVSAHSTKKALAACLVGAADSSAAVAACLCKASGRGFDFCEVQAETAVVPGPLALAWGEALAGVATELGTKMANPMPGSKYVIQTNASCTLNAGRLELALDANDAGLQGIIGATSEYSAIYMWPTLDGRPAGDPVRLCAQGEKSVIVNGGISVSQVNDVNVDFAFEKKDFGLAGGFEWVVRPYKDRKLGGTDAEHFYGYRPDSSHDVGVEFLVVAGVEAGLIQGIGGDNINALGVLASAKLKDRVVHISTVNASVEVKNEKRK